MVTPTTYTHDDLTIFLNIKENDTVAFKILFQRYYEKLCQFVVLTHDDRFMAEEVVQEVFTRVWEKRHYIEIKTSVKYYLYTACRNQAHNLVSQKSRQHHGLSNALEDMLTDTHTPESIFTFETLYQDFQQAVNALPTKAKTVFMLKYFENAKHKEIAHSMNISESMVEKHAANALRQLRKKLSQHALPVYFTLVIKLSTLIRLLF